MPQKSKQGPTVIGWREWVSLPDFGDVAIKAKIDTGAKTSALHAWNIEVVTQDGTDHARFDLHPRQKDDSQIVTALAPIVDERLVRSSNGETEKRLIVRTTIELAGKTSSIELSLTRRDEMGFRLLLGRSAMRKTFLVDPGRSFLADKRSGYEKAV